MYIISFGLGGTVMCCILKVRSHGAAAAAIFCVFHCVAAESVHTVWLWLRYSNAMLMQNNLSLLQPHRIGLEPIYYGTVAATVATTIAIAAPRERLH